MYLSKEEEEEDKLNHVFLFVHKHHIFFNNTCEHDININH